MPPVPTGERYEDLVEVFTVLSGTLAEDESVHDTLHAILAMALKLVPGCSAASVTVLDERGQPSTIAATDDDTLELDRRQYLLNDGPCMDAARRQRVNRWSLLEAEQQWPDFTSLAKEVGLRSYLAAWASVDQRLGALNLSSRDADGFSRLDEGVVALFIAPAAAAIVTMTRYARARTWPTSSTRRCGPGPSSTRPSGSSWRSPRSMRSGPSRCSAGPRTTGG